MQDRLYLPLLGVLTALVIGLALVWPQGLGDRSPPPFGEMPVQRTAKMQAAMMAETVASESRIRQAREAVADLQTRALSGGQ